MGREYVGNNIEYGRYLVSRMENEIQDFLIMGI
jgi:hypothetical protein